MAQQRTRRQPLVSLGSCQKAAQAIVDGYNGLISQYPTIAGRTGDIVMVEAAQNLLSRGDKATNTDVQEFLLCVAAFGSQVSFRLLG